jgi:hypothetical protein
VTPLPFNFHGGGLFEVSLGPRREVTLTIGLALPGRLGDHIVHIRFGGIANFEEVRDFFGHGPPAWWSFDVALGRIDFLDYDPGEVSRIDRLVFRLKIDSSDPLVIRCRNVTTWRDDQVKDDQPGRADCRGEADVSR